MATTVWKGHLTFGLISMPVRMFTAARGERVSFNQLHKECHSRLKTAFVLPVCNRNVNDPNCERLRVRKGSVRSVQRRRAGQDRASLGARHGNPEFVKLEEMDPLYFDSPTTSHLRMPA